MKENKTITLEEQFAEECEVIDLRYEYSGYTGFEKYAIITGLTEEELYEKYAELIQGYKPFLLLTPDFGEVRDEFRRNEKKHQMRAIRSVDAFSYDDEVITAFHPELITGDFTLQLIERELYAEIKTLVNKLPEKQRRRIEQYYYENKTLREIAEIEGVHYSNIKHILDNAIKNLRNNLR